MPPRGRLPRSASPFAAGNPAGVGDDRSRGRFLYVCNQSSKNITKFAIDQDTGGLPSSTITATTNLAPQAIVFAK